MIRASWGKLILPLLLSLGAACAPAAPPAPTTAPTVAPAAPAAPTNAGASAPAAAPKTGAPGYLFAATHDEIVEKAKLEGSLKVQTSADPKSIKAFKEAFSKQYPFLKVDIQELTGLEAFQRFLLETKAGTAKDWDVLSINEEYFPELIPYVEKIDVLGMAEQGILGITPKMVWGEGRNMIAPSTSVGAIAYNKTLVPPDRVPKTWEDLLKPEWKGKKMLAEIRPNTIGALVPAKGEEWVKDFARKLKEQEPVWSRGNTRSLTALGAGEYLLHSGTYFHSAQRQIMAGADQLGVAVLEPVPLRIGLGMGVQKGSAHPYASLLFLEFVAGPEGQKILDEIEPLKASHFVEGTAANKMVGRLPSSVAGWDWWPKMSGIEKMISDQYGLPKAELSD